MSDGTKHTSLVVKIYICISLSNTPLKNYNLVLDCLFSVLLDLTIMISFSPTACRRMLTLISTPGLQVYLPGHDGLD